jgi:cytochrome d ubiquinol oxidase subunit I
MDYPVWDLTLGGGMLMAIVAVLHVIVAHFAVGGGLVIAVTETLAIRKKDAEFRDLAKGSSLMLILLSTVFGAISGVGIWVVAGLISPGAISALIHNYLWGWAIEWVFFVVEIVAALVYWATWGKISKAAHVMVAWIYFVAAYMSLVIINGIITFQLTPGGWLASHAFWDGFFNPTYWPSLVLRTGIAMLMAAVFMVFLAARATDGGRLVRYLGLWLVAGSLVSYAGYRWWEAQLHGTARALFLGDVPLLDQLAATRSITLWALTVALILGGLFFVAAPRTLRAMVPGVVVALAAITFFGGYERLREGVRKPFLIHSHMFSNGLLIEDIERLNSDGLSAHAGWVTVDGTDDPEAFGRRLFQAQCAACHTRDGYQGIRAALPTVADVIAVVADDPPGAGAMAFEAECGACHADWTHEDMVDVLPTADEIRDDPAMILDLNEGMIYGTLAQLHEMGEVLAATDRTSVMDLSELPYPYMAPFVGTDDEMEALVAYLRTLDDARTTEGASL